MSLTQAAKDGDLAQVQALVSQGMAASDPEAAGEALCQAALNDHLAIVELLVRSGVDVNARRWNSITPLFCALESMNPDLIEYLLKNGADVNIRTSNGNTPLHDAVDLEFEHSLNVHGRLPTAAPLTALLVLYGAEVNAQSEEGFRPLDFTREGKHATAHEILLAHGAVAGRSLTA